MGQIFSTINTIANNLGYTGQEVVDATTFTAFANATISGGVEPVYSTLYDMVGKTVVAIDEAEDSERGITVSAFEYGAILQKLSFITQQAQTASEWDIAHPESPYAVTAKTGIVQKFFEVSIPTFSWQDVSYTNQLKTAFHTPESLIGFTDALYIRMRNAYKIAKKGLADNAIGAFMASIFSATTDANASRRVRHLLTEFNALKGTSYTGDNAYLDKDYLEYIRKVLVTDKKNLDQLTHLYNEIGAVGSEVPIDRRSKDEDLNLDISLNVASAYAKYYGDTFNDSYVKLPRHNEVVNWGISTSPNEVKSSIDGGSTTVDIKNVIAFMYDKAGVVATMDESRFVSMYDQWNDRNVFKLTAKRRYMVDPTENGIIYIND